MVALALMGTDMKVILLLVVAYLFVAAAWFTTFAGITRKCRAFCGRYFVRKRRSKSAKSLAFSALFVMRRRPGLAHENTRPGVRKAF